MGNIEQGQVWLRKGGTGYNDDQITIGTQEENLEWNVEYGDGQKGVLDFNYIYASFDLKVVPSGVWILRGGSGDPVDYIFSEDQEIEALRKMNEQGYGHVEFVSFGEPV